MMDLSIIRSDRKTIVLQIRNGNAVVRAPYFATDADIQAFICKHEAWLHKNLQKTYHASAPLLTEEQKQMLRKRAEEVFEERCSYFSEKMGVTYGKISVRMQRTRWGSCSKEGNLSFNCLLLLAPPDVLDSVVVHELCHRKYMNHSKLFYQLLYDFFPSYPQCKKWLNENGALLLAQNNT